MEVEGSEAGIVNVPSKMKDLGDVAGRRKKFSRAEQVPGRAQIQLKT